MRGIGRGLWRHRSRRGEIAAAIAAFAAAALLLGGSALAAAAFRPGPVHIKPAHGATTTVFELGFTAPERTGVMGRTERHDLLSASLPSAGTSCVARIELRTPDAPAGKRVRVQLRPRLLGGRWCAGTYTGEIQEIESGVCPRGLLCPTYAILRGIVGRFHFDVKPDARPPDRRPPRFAGLQRAFACTPGPQRIGQTTPYTLSWQPATDDVTPSGEIVYDVFYATQAGRENFSHPTWTTAPGRTSFRTPGLPSHGSAYFVVRARDRAGREDRNTVQRRGVDQCL